MRTLIVDDEPRWKDRLERIVRKQLGWEVITAEDAQAALKVITESPQDKKVEIIVCDGLNGDYLTVAQAGERLGLSFMLVSSNSDSVEDAQSRGWPTIHKNHYDDGSKFIQNLRDIQEKHQSPEGPSISLKER
jgi:DNA-binding NtrC family response regulator